MGYIHPEVLVETVWVKERLTDPNIGLIEVDVDTQGYDAGHIAGAVGFNWQAQLQDQTRRDIISQQDFEEFLSAAGGKPETTVILYGDNNNNWFAAYASWLFKYYGHEDAKKAPQNGHAESLVDVRSGHTWFVLKYLLGHENVRNYDGSWTEYGNLIGAAIEK